MGDMQKLIKLIEKDENSETSIDNIVIALTERQESLVWLIEQLESQFVSPQVQQRLRGVSVLSSVIRQLPTSHLNPDEIKIVTTFLCNKLKDHHSLIPVILQALLAVVKMTSLPGDSIHEIVNGLSVDIQSQLQSPADRMAIYQILQYLLSNKLTELQQMGTRFVYAVLGLVDSECNARNLTLVFSLLPIMLANFTLEHLAEDMFDALACYFPIDVPTEGVDVISRDVLVQLLESCLTSSEELAPHVLPLLLEKLDSSMSIAKKDSLSLLSKGCRCGIWGVNELSPFLSQLAFTLHREATRSDDTAVSSQQACAALVHALSASPVDKEQATMLPTFIQQMTKMSEHALRQVEMRGFSPSCNLLATMAGECPSGGELVCAQVVPLLVQQFQARTGEARQQATILAALTQHVRTLSPKSMETWSCTAIYLEAVTQNQPLQVRQEALRGLSVIASVLTAVQRISLHSYIHGALTVPELSEVAIECLCSFAKVQRDEVINSSILPALLTADSKEAVQAVCALAAQDDLMPIIAPRLVDSALVQQNSVLPLQALLQLSQEEKGAHYLTCECSLVAKLTQHWLEGLTQPHLKSWDQELEVAVPLISKLVRVQNVEEQQLVLQECLPRLGLHDAPLQTAINTPPKAGIALGVLGSLHRQLQLPHLNNILACVVHCAIHGTTSVERKCCSMLTACLLNKTDCDVEAVMDQIGEEPKQSGIDLLLRCTRGVLLRAHAKLPLWIQKVRSLLGTQHCGHMVADSFDLLLSEENFLLTVDNHAVVRLLYKQRLCQLLPLLELDYQECNNANVLAGMLKIMHCMDQITLAPHLQQLVPVLVKSLNLDTNTLEATLQCVLSLLTATCPALASHLSDCINACSKLATSKNHMRVRIAALQCLAKLTNYQPSQIMPHRNDVLDMLQVCLDDPKRLVRQAAVACAGRWQLLGSAS